MTAVGSIEPANADFDGTAKPLVLLTHLPLYRRDDSACGAARQQEAGHVTYRAPNARLSRHDVVSKRSSEALLKRARPDVVLSAHTHTMCEATHAIAGDAALGTAPMTASESRLVGVSSRSPPAPLTRSHEVVPRMSPLSSTSSTTVFFVSDMPRELMVSSCPIQVPSRSLVL